MSDQLKALCKIIGSEVDELQSDIQNLYRNWFIETCDQWVVPYIGDLLDVRELYAESTTTYGQQERRAYVANTLHYRRRKGTTPMLEQLTQDVTGWRSRVVEFGRLVSTSQTLSHIRTDNTTVGEHDQGLALGTASFQLANQLVEIGARQGRRVSVDG